MSGLPSDAPSELENLRTLRVLRALRLIKLSKLITGQRIIKRWETKVRVAIVATSFSSPPPPPHTLHLLTF